MSGPHLVLSSVIIVVCGTVGWRWMNGRSRSPTMDEGQRDRQRQLGKMIVALVAAYALATLALVIWQAVE